MHKLIKLTLYKMETAKGYYAHDLPKMANDDPQAAKLLEQLGERRVSQLDSATSRNVFIVIKGAPAQAIAFVQKGRPDINVNADHMQAANGNHITHVIDHEEEHFERPWSLDMRALTSSQAQTLSQELGTEAETILESTTWIEGCVEHQTILKRGKDSKVAYLDKEVPLYQKLCDLFQEHLNKDFHAHFTAGREPEIVQEMADLADIITLKNQLDKAA